MLSDIERAVASPHAVIIFGLRRVGKSALLALFAHKTEQENFYYINFENERFPGFRAEEAIDLYQALGVVFGDRKVFILF